MRVTSLPHGGKPSDLQRAKSKPILRRVVPPTLGLVAVLAFNVASAQTVRCDIQLDGRYGYGPFDYHDPENKVPTGADPMGRIKRVENVHFKPETEQLQVRNQERLESDIEYTLNVFPNHYRALISLSRLELKVNGRLGVSAKGRSPECRFNYAFDFKPDDPYVFMAYGMHNHLRKRNKEALVAYQQAEALGLEETQFFYNFGLLYFDLGDYENALTYAKKAYEAGFPLPGLRNKLQSVGKWQ